MGTPSGIPIGEWSGSNATRELHETIKRFNEAATKQTRQLLILTWVIAFLTLLMLIGLALQIYIAPKPGITKMTWETAANISTVISSAVLVITLLFGLRQLIEMKRATNVTAYGKIVDILQAEDIREARRIVLTSLRDRAFAEWSDSEARQAEKVCHTYDTVGRLVRFSMCPKDIVIDSAGDSLRRTWSILKPFILSYRETRGANYWDDYEWLVTQAQGAFSAPGGS